MGTMSRTDWLIERQKGLGGSDAAPALGMSKFKTRYDLYLDKTMPIVEQEPTSAMRWGNLLEPAVLQAYAEETGYNVESPGNEIRRHAAIEWMCCTPDAIAHDGVKRRNVQAKTARSDDGWGAPFTDDIPEEYNLQVNHEMAVLGLDVTDIPVLIGGSDFRIYTVQRNLPLIKAIIDEEREFWRCVVERETPDPVNLEDAQKRWQVAAQDYMEVDRLVLDEWTGIQIAKEKLKEWTERKEYHELQLKRVCQDNEGLLFGGKKICSWKNQSRTAVSQKKLEAEYPEVYEACKETSEIRVFRTNKVKGLQP